MTLLLSTPGGGKTSFLKVLWDHRSRLRPHRPVTIPEPNAARIIDAYCVQKSVKHGISDARSFSPHPETRPRFLLVPQALAGRIPLNKLSGEIRYNGASQQDLAKEGIKLRLLSNYVDQLDVHVRA